MTCVNGGVSFCNIKTYVLRDVSTLSRLCPYELLMSTVATENATDTGLGTRHVMLLQKMRFIISILLLDKKHFNVIIYV